MGTAPSKDLLSTWKHPGGGADRHRPDRVPPLALPPLPKDAILGTLSGDAFDAAAAEAARTAPPRERRRQPGHQEPDKGSRIFYPVFVDGANLSVGDLHFSQGDGEITFCGAIEMGGFIDLRVEIIPDGMSTYA